MDDQTRKAEREVQEGGSLVGALKEHSRAGGIYQFVPEIIKPENLKDPAVREFLDRGVAGLRPYGGGFNEAYERIVADGRCVPDVYSAVFASLVDGLQILNWLTANSVSVERRQREEDFILLTGRMMPEMMFLLNFCPDKLHLRIILMI